MPNTATEMKQQAVDLAKEAQELFAKNDFASALEKLRELQKLAINERIDYGTFQSIIPEMGTGMAAISHALRKSGIEPELFEMIKVRVSQLNGCAFCVQYHLNDARKLNVPASKLDLLAAWREAGIYNGREAAALDWAERVTLLAAHPIEEEHYARVSTHFSEREIAFLTTAIGQINFWNRVAAPLRFAPPIPKDS